ncbi:O-methyltransferase GliM2 [Aspergillus steynii IBT 23096]|uniref:O-methyltransferase GliM2 n=1 Tax=Aspergillus steynii IBT 23096 TaxID=1392250 RepID=A0A2I2G7Z3_9EURO|nr:O-methyltransferase GliM2 [Aspergillus steynii IBT 23096]PLB48991.1 O-methyltransferase GliM2 [Aspergillus steynii IBT 23096]
MENELDHLSWNIKHALSQLEGPLSQELDACLEVSPTSMSTSSAVYRKLLDTVQVLDKLLVTLTPPHMSLVDGVFAFTNSKVLLCASEYALADHVQRLQPCSISELAKSAGLHEQGLFQIIRYLREMGYFHQDPKTGKLSNNRLSDLLRKDHWATWLNWVDFFPREYYDLISHLPDQLKSDQPKTATELFYNTDKPIYQYLAETGRIAGFHKVTGTGSVVEAPGLLADYPWHEVKSETVIDIGAGVGDFIRSYLERFPDARAGAFELPSTAEILQQKFPPEDPLTSRLVSVTGGDFFKDEIPKSSVYLLRWILHNWGDEDCVKLLRRIRDTITLVPGVSRVLIVESVLFDGRLGRGARYADIRMLARCRNKERTLDEYRTLAEEAGWRVDRVVSPRGCLTQILDLRPIGVNLVSPKLGSNGDGGLEWESELR